MLLVCSDKQITVIEARRIQELGFNGPNTRTFNECMKTELNVNPENISKFYFNDEKIVPCVLIGLKSGNLLAKQLSETEQIENNLDMPYFSPNLQVWRTPLNSKLLVTGSLGIDENLVELRNNYPRFELLVKDDETDQDILMRICRKEKKLEQNFGKHTRKASKKLKTGEVHKFGFTLYSVKPECHSGDGKSIQTEKKTEMR